MKICPSCCLTNGDDAENCRECGAKLSPPSSYTNFSDPISISAKWVFWLAAWGIVIVASVAVTGTPRCILATPMFPIGLLFWLPNGENKAIEGWMTGAWAIGWLFYLLLAVVIFRIKKSGIFFIIYLIFCILLVFNVVGCQRVIQAASGIH
jgi:hypothetical protein